MTVKELYDSIGGDYEEAMTRLMTDDLAARFIVKFPEDASCNDLLDAWDAHDEKAAFQAAHRAKGVCANLSLKRLAVLTSEICEALREGNEDIRAATDVGALVDELRKQYRRTIDAILSFAAEN